MHGRNQIIMPVASLVIYGCPRPHDFQNAVLVKGFSFLGIGEHAFTEIENIAPVAVGNLFHKRARFLVDRQFAAGFPFGALQKLLESVGVQTVQHKHLASGQQRRVQLKRRILGGGADQNNRAVFHIGQKTVLLRLVKTMDFVDKQQRALPLCRPAILRILKNPLQIGHAGKNRRNLFKIKICVFGNQTRNRGFSATRRPPENKRRYFSGLYHSAQRRVFSHDVVLPDDFGQSLRTQTVGKRPFNL